MGRKYLQCTGLVAALPTAEVVDNVVLFMTTAGPATVAAPRRCIERFHRGHGYQYQDHHGKDVYRSRREREEIRESARGSSPLRRSTSAQRKG